MLTSKLKGDIPGYLADFRGVVEFKVWTNLEGIFTDLLFAPKIGSLPGYLN